MAKPISPVIKGEPEVVYAKDQPQYIPLPTYRYSDGLVISKWRLSFRELLKILRTRSIYVHQHTFNSPLQPLRVGVDEPIPEPSPSPIIEEAVDMFRKSVRGGYLTDLNLKKEEK